MKISIKSMLHSYAAGLTKTWAHDRLNTVGASEVGQCLRKTWFSKNEAPTDSDYEDDPGVRLRGDLMEEHYWIPGLLSSLPEGVRLLYSGREQRTLVDGYLSATPDGLLVGIARDCLAHLGVPDIKSDCISVECKSIDPRFNIKEEKPEHSFQVQAQMGLTRHATEHKPEFALLSYIDMSFMDKIDEFVVPFDPAIYAAAHARARRVMTETDPLRLHPEGKLAGGKECKFCAWSSHCAAVTVAGIPYEEKTLGSNAAAELKHLRDVERDLAAREDATALEHATAREAVKEFLRANGIRRYTGEDWAVSWSSVKVRETVDTKAAEKAGIDLTAFKKVGDPADRLTVK